MFEGVEIVGKLNVEAAWTSLMKCLGHKYGVEIESVEIRKRLPHEYPQHLHKQDEQIKCK